MDHIRVLKRAWRLIWRYRALWIFGIILALTTARGGSNVVQYNLSGEDFAPGGQFHVPEIPPQTVRTLIGVGIGLACVITVLFIASIVARYVAETALIRMVDDYEASGQKQSIGQGFRLGWSRVAWRLFLIDLLIFLPVAFGLGLVFAVALAPLLLWTTDSTAAGAIGTVATIGLILLAVLLAIVVAVVLGLLTHFFRRVCALEGKGVIESIRQGYDFVRRHLKEVAVMWLLMVGVGLGWMIVLIPLTILLLLLAAVLAGLPALAVGGLASLALEGATPWILGGAVGVPILILVMAVPLLFLGGLMQVFKSSVWTLTYRELRALESVEPEPGQSSGPNTLSVA